MEININVAFLKMLNVSYNCTLNVVLKIIIFLNKLQNFTQRNNVECQFALILITLMYLQLYLLYLTS